ncbi:Homeobox domain and Homeodomain-like-containing protein [Strongyloides ratti]|uniref:Homeobox domain and Homeodomain-like-containing protein n=1 Tax=Strongyloides ratti TaxID=34506 RepID=A0A090LFL2_STRRB|nr:Homeobox domain and Homeodomain-like-containing protein [Strongyloides ratti]CEF66265.1 Homeobox domain and Homeodomain-like-containing protein [Strongyloides ratti]
MEPCPVSWEIKKERVFDKVKARIRILEKEMNINIANDVKIKIFESLNINNNYEISQPKKNSYTYFNKNEIKILEDFYTNNKNPTSKDIENIAIIIKDTKERVRKWIGRKRLCEKKILKK